MKQCTFLKVITILLIVISSYFVSAGQNKIIDNRFIAYIINPKNQNIQLYWKNNNGQTFKSIQHLKEWVEKNKKKLLFAMNAGMYKEDNSPLGLFIDNKKIITPLNTASGIGNFYLKPNGVFYITTDNVPIISNTLNFIINEKIKYATQSGPMLVINNQINTAFKNGSANVNIRNGVGILPNNQIVFVMSKKEISLFDFANYFKGLGCKSALYLDGFVSRTYLPEKNWVQNGGNFGVIIGVTKFR